MSRVGEKPIQIPEGVTVSVKGRSISVKGPRGTLQTRIQGDMVVKQGDGKLLVERPSDGKSQRSLHGTVRSILFNMVEGVTAGFTRELQVVGVGYTARMEDEGLRLSVGHSHDIYFVPPDEIGIEATRNSVTVSGIDKQLVGQVAAKIRSFRPPEPYKGKGIRYSDEYVRVKKGKTVGGTATD